MKAPPGTIDAYLAALPGEQRRALEGLRATLRAFAPKAEEAISSGVPALKYGEKYLVSFGAAKRHVALYVMRGSALRLLADELRAYAVSGTVIRFAPAKPLPKRLVKKIVEIRMQEIGDNPKSRVIESAGASSRKGGKAHGVKHA